MTRKQVRKKTRQLILASTKKMRENIEKAIDSGAVDIKKYEDNYLLPKIILIALLKEEIFQYEPRSDGKNMRKVINNIYTCL